MNNKEKAQKLEMLYNTNQMDEYVKLLTEDWTEYDWAMLNRSLDTPVYNEFTGEMEESYRKMYLTND